MNITKFKEGDIITRNEPMTYQHNGSADSSWCGDRIILRGHDEVSKIIFYEITDGVFRNEIHDLSYARDAWNEGWCYYPDTLWEKAKAFIKNK